nr:hypothetical protein [Tanacetum cinerariifolium]
MMDDPNITMEEYIELNAKKARRCGRTFNWETATYGKIYCDDYDLLTGFKADFPAIVYNDASTSNQNISSEPTINMAGLPPRAQRNLWLRYEVEGYTEEIVQDYEQRLDMIFSRQVNRIHILDFVGLTEEMSQTLTDRLKMAYTRVEGHVLFTSSLREFADKGDLSDYWASISSDGDFLRVVH